MVYDAIHVHFDNYIILATHAVFLFSISKKIFSNFITTCIIIHCNVQAHFKLIYTP